MKKRIGILFGGESSEYEVSCVSAANVAENADKNKFEVYLVGITKDGKWWLYSGSTDMMRDKTWCDDRSLLTPAILSPCKAHHGLLVIKDGICEKLYLDAIFPVLHGKNGEDGTMQGLLALSGVPFVGCYTFSSAVSMDKAATKTICITAGLPVVPFFSAYDYENTEKIIEKSEKDYGYPVFVKPANAGSSVGITKAKNREELKEGIKIAFENDKKLLIEPNVSGREIEVAVCGNDQPFASVCGEVIPNSDFYDYETKYINDRSVCVAPAEIDGEIAEKIRECAVNVYKALGCSGFSRVDFFLTEKDFYLNEINTIPGFTPISMYPKLMEKIGISYKDLITKLVDLALEKSLKGTDK